MTRRAPALLTWYEQHRRDLPWRNTTDPYPIMVSEVMLQQTQASRVVPFYERFLERFPTVESLAAARLDEVLGLWRALGYPSRAKRLRQAAQKVVADGWPRTLEGLQGLPGVGPYTAAAVASFAFGEHVAVVDTNVRRVLSRWRGEGLEGAALRSTATAELSSPASTWNQAIMELGALLCRPRDPKCGECPVAADCTDPTVYIAPPRQSRFDGSDRQVRGRVLARLLDGGPATHPELGRDLGIPDDRIRVVLGTLADDGLITIDDESVRLTA